MTSKSDLYNLSGYKIFLSHFWTSYRNCVNSKHCSIWTILWYKILLHNKIIWSIKSLNMHVHNICMKEAWWVYFGTRNIDKQNITERNFWKSSIFRHYLYKIFVIFFRSLCAVAGWWWRFFRLHIMCMYIYLYILTLLGMAYLYIFCSFFVCTENSLSLHR